MTDEEALDRFKAFCAEQFRWQEIARGVEDGSPELIDIEERCVDLGGERNWYDMSIGFFMGIGCNVSQAFNLAHTSRYEHYYWCE